MEVGGGGGSMAEWLCELVGPEGEVVATDVETKFLEAIEARNLRVLAHDIVNDPLEEGAFDLIHIRAVLAHLPQRDDIVRRLVAALKPGGWLVPVVTDFSSVRAAGSSADDGEFFDRGFAAVIEAARVTGFDPFYGRGIGAVLRGHGLEAVNVEGVVLEWNGSGPLAGLYSLTSERLRDIVIQSRAMSAKDLGRLLDLMRSPEFFGLSNTLFLGRGRRPAA